MDFKDFVNNIKKTKEKRVHRATNSYGVKDAFSYYRKIRPKESNYVLTASEYLHIIRSINNILRQELIKGEEVKFPERMGKLELRKRETRTTFKNNKLRTNLPVDWKATLQLWYEDDYSYKNKKLVRSETKEVYKVFYNKYFAKYNNQTFYTFLINREIKKGLKNNINNGDIDALMIYRRYGKNN